MFLNFLFLISTCLVVVSSLLVCFSKNIMHSCVFLLTALFGVAGLYAALGADFLAATQLVVYSGGVVVLMLFAIMLTGGNSENSNKYGLVKVAAMGNIKTYLAAIIAAVVFLCTSYQIIIGLAQKSTQVVTDITAPTAFVIGSKLLTDHILAFEISSVLLLGALVGAAVISRPAKRKMENLK